MSQGSDLSMGNSVSFPRISSIFLLYFLGFPLFSTIQAKKVYFVAGVLVPACQGSWHRGPFWWFSSKINEP